MNNLLLFTAFWDEKENRIFFFEKAAYDLNFNPYISEYWQMQTNDTLLELKVISANCILH